MFKIFYDDGATYTGDPFGAPGFGALVIVEDDVEHGRHLISQCDFFCWDDRGDGWHWWGADFVGLIDYLARPGVKRVLIGRLVPSAVFARIYHAALVDPDFQPKTAFAPGHHGKIS